jgi:hypothetical protein
MVAMHECTILLTHLKRKLDIVLIGPILGTLIARGSLQIMCLYLTSIECLLTSLITYLGYHIESAQNFMKRHFIIHFLSSMSRLPCYFQCSAACELHKGTARV